MINHLRTLLLNRDGSAAAPPETPGEEYVSPDYKAVAMPQALSGLLASLFGTSPDRVFLNARLRQFLSLMRVCRLDGPIPPDNDTRLSYEGSGGETLFTAAEDRQELLARATEDLHCESGPFSIVADGR